MCKLFCEFIGEALSMNKMLLIMLIFPFAVISQPVKLNNKNVNITSLEKMSDSELRMFWENAQQNGYSIEQLKILSRAQGVSELQFSEFERRIRKVSSPKDDEIEKLEEINNNLSSIFGLIGDKNSINSEEQERVKIGVFGSGFFNNTKISTNPQLNLATPESYELGPGDELSISIWGSAENEYNSKVTKEGYIKIERIGPVYISGLTISEAKSRLKDKLSKIYSGLNSEYNKVFFDLSLLNTRSIVINIAGNVTAPGTYTFSSLTSPLNAIYAAGGPSDNGSYREIKLIRGNKLVKIIDLYDYFAKGLLENFSLRDQDVILIPSYQNRVFLNGEFKNTGIFEMKENETISDLLLYSGGISSFGVKNEVYIERIDNLNKIIKTVSYENFKSFNLNDGDIIEARVVGNQLNNSVSVEGAINKPGFYELSKNLNVNSLIKSAGGLKENALKQRAYLIRSIEGFEQEVKSIDLEASFSLLKDYKLKNNDKLVIASVEELTSSKQVSIRGEINQPGNYIFFNGMTAVDLILMAKGISERGSNSNIIIYRSTYDESQENPVETLSFDLNTGFKNLDSNQNIELNANDLIVIRSKLGYKPKEYISVSGLVKNPGDYAIKTNKYSVFDLINDFGGFLPDAELNGVKIKRPTKFERNREIIADIKSDSLEIELDEYIEIGLNISKIMDSKGAINQYNLVLKSGDKVIIPKIDNSVEVAGEVQQPTALSFYKGLSTRNSINKAGGFSVNAKKSNVYVVYQNGSIGSTKSFLFFKNYPKLLPGSRIFVPKKVQSNNKTSVTEIVGYTTSLVSIIALIKSF